jgi:hypothetical protein
VTAELTPEAVIGKDGRLQWIRFMFSRKSLEGVIGCSEASGGYLLLRIDNLETIRFPAINKVSDFVHEERLGGDVTERAIFDVKRDQLQKIAGAKEVKARYAGMSSFIDLPRKHYQVHQDWLPYMKQFYEALPK